MSLPRWPVLKYGSLVFLEHEHTVVKTVLSSSEPFLLPLQIPLFKVLLHHFPSPTHFLPALWHRCSHACSFVCRCISHTLSPTHPASHVPCVPRTPRPTYPESHAPRVPCTPSPTHPAFHASRHPTHPESLAPRIIVTLCFRKKLGSHQEAGFNSSPSLLLIASSVDRAEVAHICRGSSSAEVA